MSGNPQTGGSQSQSSNSQSAATNAAQLAAANGTAGTAGGAAAAAAQNIPQWQKGLLAAVTGNPAYGKNAPALNQLLATTAQGAGGQQQMQQRPQMQMQQRPQQAGAMATPGMGAPQGTATPAPAQGMPQTAPGMASGGMGMPQQAMGAGGMNPQMLAQLKAQYPQMFGGGAPGQ